MTLFLFIGVGCGTASRCDEFGMVGTNEAGLGFIIFGVEAIAAAVIAATAGVFEFALLETSAADAIVSPPPLNLSSCPERSSSTSLAFSSDIDDAVTCCECPISTSFFLSSTVSVLLNSPGYLL